MANTFNKKNNSIIEPRINHEIKGVTEVRLIYKEHKDSVSENDFNKVVPWREAIRLASNETKQKNRFVVDTNNENVETKQECNCKCENNNNPAIQQEYTQEAQDVRQDNKVLYIQVGVYSNFDNANAFAEKLRRNGISNVRLIDERGRVKVVIGGFETKSSGKTTINKLYDIGIYDYFWKEIR